MTLNVQTTAQLHSSRMLATQCSKNSPSEASTVYDSRTSRCSAGFRKGRRTRDQIANICWIIKKPGEFQKAIYFCFVDYAKALLLKATALTCSFSHLEPVCCSMSSSNCCFLTCIQVSQEADQVVWYAHLFQNFPQFIVMHTVKGFGRVNKAKLLGEEN